MTSTTSAAWRHDPHTPAWQRNPWESRPPGELPWSPIILTAAGILIAAATILQHLGAAHWPPGAAVWGLGIPILLALWSLIATLRGIHRTILGQDTPAAPATHVLPSHSGSSAGDAAQTPRNPSTANH